MSCDPRPFKRRARALYVSYGLTARDRVSEAVWALQVCWQGRPSWGAGPSVQALGPIGGPLPRGWARGVRHVGHESVGLRDVAGLHRCLGSDFWAFRRRTAAILATDLRMLSSQA